LSLFPARGRTAQGARLSNIDAVNDADSGPDSQEMMFEGESNSDEEVLTAPDQFQIKKTPKKIRRGAGKPRPKPGDVTRVLPSSSVPPSSSTCTRKNRRDVADKDKCIRQRYHELMEKAMKITTLADNAPESYTRTKLA